MSDERYAPHLALPAIGPEGQRRIRQSRVVVVGLGGLGCPASLYLAAAGVGALTLCDFDRVSATNLSRQLLYGPDQVGAPKATTAAQTLATMNPAVEIHTVSERIDRHKATELAESADLLLDASDNYATRLAINDACLRVGTPWIMGAAIRLEGQLAVFRPDRDGSPCYRCAYGSAPDLLEDCPGAGVLGPVAGTIGTAMATQALLLLAGAQGIDRLILLDGSRWEWHGLQVRRNPDCEACTDA